LEGVSFQSPLLSSKDKGMEAGERKMQPFNSLYWVPFSFPFRIRKSLAVALSIPFIGFHSATFTLATGVAYVFQFPLLGSTWTYTTLLQTSLIYFQFPLLGSDIWVTSKPEPNVFLSIPFIGFGWS